MSHSEPPRFSRMEFPDELEVEIEVPRFGFLKRTDDGRVDYVSPLPCPFNYGSVPGTLSGDGDRLDALVLGPSLPRGVRVRVPVRACVAFVDAGQEDPKYVCSARRLAPHERRLVALFFVLYARAKALLNLARGKQGPTRYLGLIERSAGSLDRAGRVY